MTFRCIIIFALIFGGVNTHAGVILGPSEISVSAQGPTWLDTNVDNLINQSGLSANYTSGVTDFDSFASSTTAGPDYTAAGLGLAGVAGLGSFFFDLGDIFNVDSIAVWGQWGGSATASSYALYSSNRFGEAGTRDLIGSFTLGASGNAYTSYFDSVSTQFLEIDILSNHGYSGATRLNEVIFGGATAEAPEPSIIVLLSLGLLGLSISRRQQRV